MMVNLDELHARLADLSIELASHRGLDVEQILGSDPEIWLELPLDRKSPGESLDKAIRLLEAIQGTYPATYPLHVAEEPFEVETGKVSTLSATASDPSLAVLSLDLAAALLTVAGDFLCDNPANEEQQAKQISARVQEIKSLVEAFGADGGTLKK